MILVNVRRTGVAATSDQLRSAAAGDWAKANPVKLIDTATMAPEAAEVGLTPHGNRRVTLDG